MASRTAELEIRPVRLDELPAATVLLRAQLDEHELPTESAALARALETLVRRPDRGRLLVASSDGQLIGIAALSFSWPLERPEGCSAWLEELYVVPARRGQGIGERLLHEAIAAAAAAGAVAVDLEVAVGHERAAHLYQREGFRRLPREHWVRPIERPAPPTRAVGTAVVTGGCCCGAVRYRIEAPLLDVAHCHCGTCRRASGAPLVTWVTVPASAFAVTAGTPATFAASARAERAFCGACGTALTWRGHASPDTIDVTVGSLDAPESVVPTMHIWTSRRLSWLRVDDQLPSRPEGES
jgi:GNAT superfamily N-acetyltransferase